jgi:hypothetical protein
MKGNISKWLSQTLTFAYFSVSQSEHLTTRDLGFSCCRSNLGVRIWYKWSYIRICFYDSINLNVICHTPRSATDGEVTVLVYIPRQQQPQSCHMHVWLQMGFGLIFRFIVNFKTPLITTLYSSVLNTHQCTLSVTVSSYLFLITVPANGDSSSYVLASLPAGKYPISGLLVQLFLLKYLGTDCIEKTFLVI